MDFLVSLLPMTRGFLPLYQWMLIGLVFFLLGKTVIQKSKGHLPPGPRGLPFIGNVLQLPKSHYWKRFNEWKEEFGPIFSLNLAGTSVVVLSSRKAAVDLLDRRSTIYSDRPRSIVGGEILTGGLLLAVVGYGDLWRKLRRIGHDGLNVRAVEDYRRLQEKDAVILLSDLIRDPGSWDDHLQRAATSTILSGIYAWPPIKSKDPVVSRIHDIGYRFTRASIPGAYLVDIFPIMKHVPAWMARWKREHLEWHRQDTQMFDSFMDGVSATMAGGHYESSFAASLLERKDQNNLSKKEMSWLAGTMILAGSDTTAAVLSVFILAMVLYPDVMRKAQREIDAVVGHNRLPSISDGPNMPYIRALVKEVLRWRTIAPTGVPRRSVKDDWYQGYFIPAGTIIIPNIWSMNRDPDVYPDFDEFRPERFLESDGETEIVFPDTHGQGHFSYGFGRRICIGMHLANQALFIDIASILWAMNIEKAADAEGNYIIPSRTDSIDNGLVVLPVPFKCNIVSRSKDVEIVIKNTRKGRV